MLKKRIIPCLDVKKGRVVKGIQYLNHKDIGDPAELGKYYSDQGADELIFYDITASPEERDVDLYWVEKVAKYISLPFTVAGGIRSIEQAKRVLNAGADKISINTPAIENPDLINQLTNKFGSQCVVVGTDVRNGEIYQNTGNPEKMSQGKWKILDWIQEVQNRGAGEIVINSIRHDGGKQGYDIKLLRAIKPIVHVPIIASSGAGKAEHFYEIFSENIADGGLAASIFHSGEVSISEVKQYLKKRNIPVRDTLLKKR
jgi:cyclase